jgi:hypothetical protein
MPVTYRIEVPSRVAIVTWPHMAVQFQMWRALVEELLNAKDFRPGFSVVSDWRELIGAPDSNFVHTAVSVLEQAHRRGIRRWASVIPADSPLAYGVGRMVEIEADIHGFSYRVFREYSEALAWATES